MATLSPLTKNCQKFFLQLRISEKTGRGIPLITNTYGRKTIKISNNSILVTTPYNKVNEVGNKVGNKNS